MDNTNGGNSFTGTLDSFTVTVVPEPGTWATGALSLGMLGFCLRRRVAGMFKRQSVA